MVRGNFGKLCDYDNNKEDRQSYVKRLELFFTANYVVDAQKRRAILLTSRGIETYRLFKGFTAPAKPLEKTFDVVVTLWQIMKIQKGIQLLRDFSLTCATGRQEKLSDSTWQD